MVVLGYIANDSKRFHVFVANRVQTIRDATSVEQWHHVDTKSNPADIASRGMGAEELMNSSLWWKGPPFLSQHDLPLGKPDRQIACDDPEIKKVTVHNTSNLQVQFCDLPERLQRFSAWNQAVRAVALCIRLRERLRNRTVKRPKRTDKIQNLRETIARKYDPPDVREMQVSENVIIAAVQLQAFPGDKIAREDRDCRTERTVVTLGSMCRR